MPSLEEGRIERAVHQCREGRNVVEPEPFLRRVEIDDVVVVGRGVRHSVEDEDVGADAAGQRIVAEPADQPVGAAAANQRVAAQPAVEYVGGGVAVNRVGEVVADAVGVGDPSSASRSIAGRLVSVRPMVEVMVSMPPLSATLSSPFSRAKVSSPRPPLSVRRTKPAGEHIVAQSPPLSWLLPVLPLRMLLRLLPVALMLVAPVSVTFSTRPLVVVALARL